MAGSETANHHDAEQRMRELIGSAGLPEPDEVRYEFDPNEVVFMWSDPKLAVIVGVDDEGIGEPSIER